MTDIIRLAFLVNTFISLISCSIVPQRKSNNYTPPSNFDLQSSTERPSCNQRAESLKCRVFSVWHSVFELEQIRVLLG